jgi:polyhydroxyalkanoate synthase
MTVGASAAGRPGKDAKASHDEERVTRHALSFSWSAFGDGPPRLAPTPKDVVLKDGNTRLLRFRDASGRRSPASGAPLLLVPSLINKWYVLDLRPGASLVEALVSAGIDTYCLDWVGAEDEDRHVTWDDLVAKIARASRFMARSAGAQKLGLLGYCMGGTLAAIAASLEPERYAALVNLAGPIDFAHSGALGEMVAPEHFDVDSIAAAGNVSAAQMQAGFVMLRPTLGLAKWVGYFDRAHDPKAREAFAALEAWSSDNVSFPAAAYVTYIRELYQENRLRRGDHFVAGKRADLSNITCPVMTVVAAADTICPPAAATALGDLSSAREKDVLSVPGGHVGAVVGSRATRELYPPMISWLKRHLGQGGVVRAVGA